MKCCFCNEKLNGIGNSPYPFFVFETNETVGCCDTCNAYITPFRRLFKKYNISNEDLSKVAYDIKDNLQRRRSEV